MLSLQTSAQLTKKNSAVSTISEKAVIYNSVKSSTRWNKIQLIFTSLSQGSKVNWFKGQMLHSPVKFYCKVFGLEKELAVLR